MRRDVFQAIADPTRRKILSMIARQSLNINSVAENFAVSRTAIYKHIKILTECGLIVIKQQGRARYCEARLQKLRDVSAWVGPYCKYPTDTRPDDSLPDKTLKTTYIFINNLNIKTMATKIFVNLPVKDLNRSVAFFTKLGFTFNAQFTDENATCMVVGEDIFVMLLVEKFFKTFTKKEIADATKSTEVIIALSAESRQKVDEMVNKAIAAGATTPNEKQDMEFMYGWGFQDLDGHLWEVSYMDPSAIQQGS